MANESDGGCGRRAGLSEGIRTRTGDACYGLVDSARVDSRTLDVLIGRGIERQMKGEITERTQTIVREDLSLRVKAPNRVGLMEMADGEQLGAKDERGCESA